MSNLGMGITAENFWTVQHWRKGGLLWQCEFPNLVTTQGKNDLLTRYFEGTTYTAAWYVGLISNTGFTAYAVGDTAAQITTTTPVGGNNQWQEATVYSARIAWSGGSASGGSISNTLSPASIPITGPDTIRGAFLDSTSTAGGTSGVLYGEGDFSTPRAVLNGDTLLVTVTLTVS